MDNAFIVRLSVIVCSQALYVPPLGRLCTIGIRTSHHIRAGYFTYLSIAFLFSFTARSSRQGDLRIFEIYLIDLSIDWYKLIVFFSNFDIFREVITGFPSLGRTLSCPSHFVPTVVFIFIESAILLHGTDVLIMHITIVFV